MLKYFTFLICLISFNLSAQSIESDPLQEPSVEETMEEAMKELSELFDEQSLDSLMMQAFKFDGQGFEQLDLNFDSLGLGELFEGEELSQLFGQSFENLDFSELNQMMEQGMKMLENIDPAELEQIMEGFDVSEMMQLFEGMELDGFENLIPPPTEETPPGKDGKKLKKI